MEKKSKVLIIGATGRLGYHLAKFSTEYCHPTFALIRDSSFNDPNKQQKLQSLSIAGVTFLKRFIPSEFGADPDKSQISDLDNNFYSRKSEIRRLIEAGGIPYTYICCNLFMSYLLPSLVQPGLKTPPRDKVTIFGDGNTKGVFVNSVDVAAFTISALDDPRTLNKVLYLRPPGNVCCMNELVEAWESKIGKKLEKINVSEEELLKKIKDVEHGCGTEHVTTPCNLNVTRQKMDNIPTQLNVCCLVQHAAQLQVNITILNPQALLTEIRRLIKAEGIPYTCICCNFFMSRLLPSLVQLNPTTPPTDKLTIFGDGNTRGVFVKDTDVAAFTINALDDPRTLNKLLHLRSPGCVHSVNKHVETWESKIAKKLERIYVPAEELVKKIKETPFPENKEFIFIFSAFVKGDQPRGNIYSFNDLVSLWEEKIGKALDRVYVAEDQLLKNIQEKARVLGDQTNFEIEPSFGVEATELYPDVNYTTVDEYLNQFI
ncbi:putative pinoresinol-lariciresinol reductase 3 [Citrus sinensis]|nr:putative pinoresinol-lariciresinol reductase 3 [Citrus sinensis]